MKKIVILLFATAFIFPAVTFAQKKVKFGHLDMEAIYAQMPGTDTLQTHFQAYLEELENEGLAMQNEVQKAYNEYQQKQATYSPAVAKVKEEEIQKMLENLQEFEKNAQLLLQEKKEELLMPFQEKIMAAAKEVGKEGGYTYIFDASKLSYAAESEDIADMVKAKLGIK
ncbi:MAG: OmpH family outer membrane protein [Bacteroidales bacterium]|nr:OmpH family outer membrane protein [Bacteroidales bacterium]